ncbi:MAG TPA: replication-associated recombination protein A [Candidatus Latescibacteria bacterium]|nr:replication-associated recombination protein A [Candidatus Latescibacterota bacterium]
MNLFEEKRGPLQAPLADRMRPRTLAELVGQDHILGEGKILRRAIEQDEFGSIILWGPPGSGKTSLAQIIANRTGARFVSFSAVISGVKEIREVIAKAKHERNYYNRRTILFVDEIHRFNKAQQDAFLPHVENGTIILIGATTENPSFEVNSPLLSRSRVFVLNPLTEEELGVILRRALSDKERGLGNLKVEIAPSVLRHIAQMADGDARVALNALEMMVLMTPPNGGGLRHVTLDAAEEAMQKKALLYDRQGEEHYNIISAFHKSMRGSDPDAALYWLARMLEAGEDPLYVARRMIRFASEDIGNADPRALSVAIAAKDAFHFLGHPEGELALAQAAVYLATAPKSNAIYVAYEKVKEEVQKTQNLPVPLHIRNAPTKLMTDLGYGRGYKYPHNFKGGYVVQDYLPENLKGRRYYYPTDQGNERKIKERLEHWERLKGKGQAG